MELACVRVGMFMSLAMDKVIPRVLSSRLYPVMLVRSVLCSCLSYFHTFTVTSLSTLLHMFVYCEQNLFF